MLRVEVIASREAIPWLLTRHYARRTCPISFAFGIYRDAELIGVVTYRTPASAPLRSGVCGPDWSDRVLELNRLCCENAKNIASMLVGRSMALLPKPSIVVSYADIAQGHIGYVYQATNFLYTGLSAKRTNWAIKGREGLHGSTVADISRGQSARADYMRETFGDAFHLVERSRKHRYVFIAANRRDKATILKAMRYKTEPYPKGDSIRYDASAEISTQMRMFWGENK
jgi:hypothetical protein